MDKNIIKEMISRQLDLIIEQFNNLNKHKGKIPQIDIDIVKRNVSILYEQLFELEKENTTSLFDKYKEVKPEVKHVEEAPIAKIIEETMVEEEEEEVTFPVDITPEPEVEIPEPVKVAEEIPVAPEPVVEVAPEPAVVIEEQIIPKEEPIIVAEKPIVKVEPIIVVEEPVINKEEPIVVKEEPITIVEPVKVAEPIAPTPTAVEKKEEKHTDLFGSAATIADKFKKNETKTMIDKISSGTAAHTIGARHQQHAIKDLKSAIGINEKFLFINELFKGNMKEFNDFIIKLNDFPSLTEAEDCLMHYKNRHNWADDLVTYLTLKDFVIRRYM